MRVDLQRKADQLVGTFLCRMLSLFYRRHTVAASATGADRILVILLSEMGSHILAYPMYKHIKSKFPDDSLYVLVFETNREILEILDIVPPQNILTINNESMMIFLKNTVRVLTQMRRIKFDIVIDCELFARISSILSFLSGAPIRVGFHPYTQEGLYRGNFINRPVLYNPYHHLSRQYVILADAIDSSTVPTSKEPVVSEKFKIPHVRFGKKAVNQMKKRLYVDFPSIRNKKLVLIYPSGGLIPIRAWPLPYFCRVSSDLLREGYAVGVIGLKGDKEFAGAILSHCQDPHCVDLTGYTRTIRELMSIFHLASLLITNDGGPGHFAAMTPIPSIIFYGPETPALYGPLNEKAVVFYAGLSCSPCLTAYNHRNSPCDGDNVCLKSIHPDEVLTKALEMLEGKRSVAPIVDKHDKGSSSAGGKNFFAGRAES